MGIFDRWLRPDKQKAVKPLDAAWSNIFLKTASEITTNEQNDENYINRGYRMNPTVYSIINTVSKNAGMVKWGVYKKGKDGTKSPTNNVLLEELLYKPNPLGTWNHLIQQAIGFKMLTGNTFMWGIKGSNDLTKDLTTSLYVLPSQHVQIHANESRRAIQGYGIEFFGRDGDDIIPADEVLHIKDFNPRFNFDGDFLYGQSPLRAALTPLYTNNDALETSRSYLLNQGPRGILSMKMDDTYGEYSEEQTNALRARFKSNHTGTKRAGDLLVAPGDWSWVEIGSSAADLKLIEHYNLTVNDICNIYSFPTILIGNGETTFANLKEAKKALWNNVIIPLLTELRDGLNSWLSPQFGRNVCVDFDLSGIHELQEDLSTQAGAVQKLQNVITVNEARAIIGLAPIEGPEGEEMYRFVQGTENDRDAENQDQSDGREEDSKETQ